MTALLIDANCVACGGTGLNSKGNPCSPCKANGNVQPQLEEREETMSEGTATVTAPTKPKKKTPPIILAGKAVGRQTKQLAARTGIDERVQGNMVAYLTGLQAYVGARALARFADPENLPSQDSIYHRIYAEGKQALAAQDFESLLDGVLGDGPSEGAGAGGGGAAAEAGL